MHPTATHERPLEGKEKLRRIRTLLAEDTGLEAAYARARDIIRRYRTSGFYEITQRCNLTCEGCYYFESENDPTVPEQSDTAAWDAFFQSERRRGVSMGYFVGAEPALEQERLLVASRHIPYGSIGTNGTVRIDPAVPYKIHVSVWGDDKADGELRGGSVFRKALRVYRDDPRVVALYTLNHRNIGALRETVARCQDHGIKLTPNFFSPTTAYLEKLRTAAPNDRHFFRTSTPQDNLMLTREDHASIRHLADELLDEFPDTFLYTRSINRLMTSPEFGYRIDAATGMAEDCRSRIRDHLKYFTADLQESPRKCCTSDVDCSSCRMYSGAWSGRLDPGPAELESRQSFAEWVSLVDTLGQIFVNDTTAVVEPPSHPAMQQVTA